MRNKKKACSNKHMMKLHKDKRGMSLVEVIVAITILGLVAVPVLHSMTTAMVYNAKARNRQELTLTAESIMETFKGYDLDELFVRFGGDSDTSKAGDGGSGGLGIEEVNAPSSGYSYTYAPFSLGAKSTRKYEFKINGMEADNGQSYDVTITATPNGVEEVMEPENMEPTRDAIFKGDDKYDTEALGQAVNDFVDNQKSDLVTAFLDDADDKGYNGAYVEIAGEKKEIAEDLVDNNKMNIESYIQIDEKRLTFEITKDSGDSTYVVTAKLQYTYHFTDYPYYVKKGTSSRPSDDYVGEGGSQVAVEHEEEWESETLQWNNAENALSFEVTLSDVEKNVYKNPTAAKLERLFVYYYPNYSLKDGADKILIDNQTDRNMQCYIIKQRTPKFSNNSLQTKESRYKAYVEVKNGAGGSCEIFHNFYDNIGGGSSTTDPSITGTNITGQYSYTKKSSEPSGTNPGIVTKFEKTEVLSYSLVLEITQGEEPDKKRITKIESTMNEKIKPEKR